MRKALLFIAAALSLATFASAQVAGTPHDLSSNLPTGNQQICVFCHTPHQITGQTTDPLWNHTLSATTVYNTYSSITMNAAPADIGTGVEGAYSRLCMSCHDATVGLGSLYNNPNNAAGGEDIPTNVGTMISGTANLGTDLSNDHPVNFVYDTTLVTNDGGLVAVASLPTWALVGGRVQCSSCHDPHDNGFFPFLNASNDGSLLCSSCHTK